MALSTQKNTKPLFREVISVYIGTKISKMDVMSLFSLTDLPPTLGLCQNNHRSTELEGIVWVLYTLCLQEGEHDKNED